MARKKKIRLLPLMSMESAPPGRGKLATFRTTNRFATKVKLVGLRTKTKGKGFRIPKINKLMRTEQKELVKEYGASALIKKRHSKSYWGVD